MYLFVAIFLQTYKALTEKSLNPAFYTIKAEKYVGARPPDSKKLGDSMNINTKSVTRAICFNAVVASIYFVLTTFTQAIAFGPIQFRIAEAFCILPALIPSSIIGLTIGCALANLFSPYGVWDIILGTLITLIAAFLTSKIKKIYIAPLPPVFLNALGLPLIWLFTAGDYAYFINVVTLLAGEGIVIYALGIPLYYALKKALPLIGFQLNI